VVVECDDLPCVLGIDADGVEIQICYPDECVAGGSDSGSGSDAEPTTVECPPGGGGGDPGPTPGDPACDGTGFLKYPEGSCGADDAEPTCAAIPEVCPELWGPVCGCDGVTYANSCFADGNAVSIAHGGECEDGPIGL
jgi:hypothetical protein